MTTKFSQRGGTQTLPPVCRSTVIIPIPWDPPPYPDIIGFVECVIERWDATLRSIKRKATLHYNPDVNQWIKNVTGWDYNLDIGIGPAITDEPLRVQVFHWVNNAPMLHTSFYGPEYYPQHRWISGTKHFKYEGQPFYSYQSFATCF